jgi:hypothetical protein
MTQSSPTQTVRGAETAPEGRSAKLDRARQMLAAFRQGYSPLEISRTFGVTQRCVYVRLNALGVDFEEERPSDIWSMPEEDRRRQIAIRAARGARVALKQIRSHSPLSAEFTGAGQVPLTPRLVGRDASS